MSDSREEKKASGLKISQLILSGKSLNQQIERLKKERFLKEKVIDLNEYRSLCSPRELKTVLVVDDEESIREVLAKALEREGYKVLCAKDALDLAKIIEKHSFDLILLDLRLPWVNGFELCYIMKRNQLLRDIPIIFMSGETSKEEIRKAFEAGCDEFIIKPFDLERILRSLKYFLENY